MVEGIRKGYFKDKIEFHIKKADQAMLTASLLQKISDEEKTKEILIN